WCASKSKVREEVLNGVERMQEASQQRRNEVMNRRSVRPGAFRGGAGRCWPIATVRATARSSGRCPRASAAAATSSEPRVGMPNLRSLSAGRGIGDFTEDGVAACAGGCRNVGRALVEGLVGEDSEGQGFFGVGGDIERS